MIHVFGSSRYRLPKKEISEMTSRIMEKFQISPDRTLNIIFVGRRKMIQIAKTYKHEPVALPVLSFPYLDEQTEDRLLGEVFLCYPQVVLLAAEREKRVNEMTRQLLEHGIKNLIQ